MQTKMILRPLSTNVHSPNSSHCKFGAWQNSEVAGARMTLEIELKYDFSKVIAQIPLLPCVLRTVWEEFVFHA